MSTNPTNIDRVEYTLQHRDYKPLIIIEPVGWKSDDKELARNKKYHGILTKFTGSLKFVGDGAKYITNIYLIYGINELISLRRRERHPVTNKWVTTYIGVIDMSTYEIQDGQVSVKFNNSSLEQILKSRESKKIEIERSDDMDGNTIDPLETKLVQYDGSEIFLKSKWSVTESNNSAGASVETNAGNTRARSVGFPFKLITDGHLGLSQSVTPETNAGSGTDVTVGDLGMMVMYDSDRDRVLDIKLINGKTNIFIQQHENVDWAKYWICITKYENGAAFSVKERIPLYKLEDDHPYFGDDYDIALESFYQNNVAFEYSNPNFELLAGESIAIEGYLISDMHTDIHAGVRVFAQDIEGDLFVDEKSFFESSQGKMILAHDLGERLSYVMTGQKGIFYSEALGTIDHGYEVDGFASLTGYTHGHWIRGFDKEPIDDDENKYKPFTTSFKDFTQDLSVTRNLGLGIEKYGYKERIRMEALEYFYNNNVLIKLGNEIDGVFVYPRVKKLKRTVAKEYYYDKIQIGSQKGWENEEAQGLDEANTRVEYSTPITRIQNTFLKVTKYVLGRYPHEFTRRKPKSLYSTYDHKYDKDIFPLDLKRGTIPGLYLERKWEDDFEEKPTGIFSPDTANKLRYSPINILLKHGWVISASLIDYIDKHVMFGGSEGNSNLKTKKIGGNAYKENGFGESSRVIQGVELERARFVPEWIEFEFPADFLIMEQVEGTTEILGKKVPNFYGLVQFKNENGQLEKGFLFNLKPNGVGKWKLLKANR